MSLCSKPGCQGAAAAVLSYDYRTRVAALDDPVEGLVDPHLYVLCSDCAERLTPPRGWTLNDQRSAPPLFLPRGPETITVRVHEVIGAGVEAPVVTETLEPRQGSGWTG